MNYKLSELLEDIIDNRGKNPAYYTDFGHVIIDNFMIKSNLYPNLKEGKRCIDESLYNSFIRKKSKKDDVLITLVGNGIGNVTLMPDNCSEIIQNTIGLRTNELINSYYLYYYLKNEYKSLLNYDRGTSQPSIKKSDLLNHILYIPELRKQRKVVVILTSLDKKIELNNQIISTLEELASTLFKRWFVDFEFPDENGNPYKSSGGKMIDSELGEIPEGWDVLELNQMVDRGNKTFNPSKSDEELVNHFSFPNFDSFKYPVIEEVASIKSNKTVLEAYPVLFSKMNPDFDRTWLPDLNEMYPNVCSPEFIVLSCTDEVEQTFIYFLCKSDRFRQFLMSNTTGSTGSRQRIKPTIAVSYKMSVNNQVVDAYSDKCVDMTKEIKKLRNMNQNLIKMRDSLLPKLLSGEIDLSDVEEG